MARSTVNDRRRIVDTGWSAVFNGSNGKIDVPGTGQLSISDVISVGCFVNIGRITGSGFTSLLCKGSNESYNLDYDQANNRFRFVINTGSGFRERRGGIDSAKLNQWALVVGTYNSVSGVHRIYVNDALVESVTVTGGALLTNSTALGVGYRSGSNDRWMPSGGLIALPFVYNGELSLADIQEIWRNKVFPTANLRYLSYLRGDAVDESGNGNNGTAANLTYSLRNPSSVRTISNYVHLPGSGSNALTTPDATALDIASDVDLLVALQPHTPITAAGSFVGKYNPTGNQRGYDFGTNSNGTLYLVLSSNGTATASANSSVALPSFIKPLWVRATWRQSDGRVQFFTAPYSASQPTTWTQLGSDGSIAISSISNNTSLLCIGQRGDGSLKLGMRVYRAIVKDGIDGIIVFDADVRSVAAGVSSFTERSSNGATVTVVSAGADPARVVSRTATTSRVLA